MQDEVQYEVGPHSSAIEPILLAAMGGAGAVANDANFLPLWDLGQIAQQS